MENSSEAKNEVSKTEALGTEKISRLILRFAATTLAALVLNAVYNLTDTLFVSWGVGDNAMGGVSVVFPFVILQSAISTALGGGAASIVSRKLGEGKAKEAGEITLNAMLAFYATAIVVTAAGFLLMNPLLNLMGVTGDLLPYAKQYFIIILAGNVFSTGFSSIIRAEGKMLYGLLIWVLPISVNIILDAVFILVLGWGVRGSAAATVACQFISFCMSVLFFSKFTSQSFAGAKPKLKKVFEVLAIGIPSLVQMGSLSIISVLINNVLRNVGGTLGVTSFAYVGKIVAFGAVPFTAVTQALAPVAGYNLGSGNLKRVKQAAAFSACVCFVYAVAALIVAEAMPQILMRVFTDNPDIVALGANSLRIISVSLLFAPPFMLAGAVFQAAGKKALSLLMYAVNLLFLLPLIFIMAKFLGMDGVWWSYVLSTVGASAVAAAVVVPYFLKNKKQS